MLPLVSRDTILGNAIWRENEVIWEENSRKICMDLQIYYTTQKDRKENENLQGK